MNLEEPPSDRPRLYWKLEDRPEGSEAENPNDVGPAWIDYPDGGSEPLEDGRWITRARARKIATEASYAIIEDE